MLTDDELERARAQWKAEKSKRTFEEWLGKWVTGLDGLPGYDPATGKVNIVGHLVNGQMVPGPSPEGYVWDGIKPAPCAMGKRPELQPPPGYVPIGTAMPEDEDEDEDEDPDMAELRKGAKELGWDKE